MEIAELGVENAFLIMPDVHSDHRGLFLEVFSQPVFERAVGHRLSVAQLNCSVSRRGTIRGMHAIALPGQARYVTCAQGGIVDIVLDIRLGSPTYGAHVAVDLTAANRRALYLAEGLAHGFAPLTDDATVVYLCSSTWAPGSEVIVNALDPDLGLPWPTERGPVQSAKDAAAPSLREARELGLLPTLAECQARYAELADLTFTR